MLWTYICLPNLAWFKASFCVCLQKVGGKVWRFPFSADVLWFWCSWGCVWRTACCREISCPCCCMVGPYIAQPTLHSLAPAQFLFPPLLIHHHLCFVLRCIDLPSIWVFTTVIPGQEVQYLVSDKREPKCEIIRQTFWWVYEWGDDGERCLFYTGWTRDTVLMSEAWVGPIEQWG